MLTAEPARPATEIASELTADGEPLRDAFALAALRRETEALAETPPSGGEWQGRNAALNIAAVKLGGFVPDRLSQSEVEEALFLACEANGLMAEGKAGVRATIRSGLAKGMSKRRLDGLPSSADADFADVEFPADDPALTEPHKVLEFPSDISLEKIRLRQSSAIVRGLLHPKETAMLYGASGTGKSFIGLDLAWHVADGREWHGRRVKQSAVLYVCLEGVDGFRKRMLAYQRAQGDPGKNFARHARHVSLVKSETGKQGADRVIEAARILSEESRIPTRLIFIDTLARAMAGDDENATAEMTNFAEKRAGYIARATGAAVVIVHHTNAAGAARGNGSLWAGCDAVLRADRERDGDRRTLIAEKVKDGTEGPLFNYSLEQVELGEDDEGTPITSCVVRTTPFELSPPTAKPKKLPRYMRVFREAFDAALDAGHKIESPSGIDGLSPHQQVSLQAIRDEFFRRYPTDADDAKVAQQTKARQLRLALDAIESASDEFEIGEVGGVRRVWRVPDLSVHPDHLFD